MKIYTAHKPLVFAFAVGLLIFSACTDWVEEGYRPSYEESEAALEIQPLGFEMGASGDVVSYQITASSEYEIKSCVVQYTYEGASGTGYDVGTEGYDDPFADHNYGTIKKGVKSFKVKYDFIIPDDINKTKLSFSIIDEQGKKTAEANINVVPKIKKYSNKRLYAKNNVYHDAFATIDGIVYPDIITNYSSFSAENNAVQEKIDIVFLVNNNKSYIAAPSYYNLAMELDVENQTKFKKLNSVSIDDFNSITPASLVNITTVDSISYYGSYQVSNIKTGDIIGFTTDLNAVHSLKVGLIKVNEIHPAQIDRYEGKSFMLECDIVTQID